VSAKVSIMFVTALVTLVTSLQVPAAFAQEEDHLQQRDPNEGQPKHEINELQNKLHHTEDQSKQNHIEGRIDTLQDVQAGGGNGGAGWYQQPGLKRFYCPGGSVTSTACINERYQKRDLCIAGATFTFGLALLHPDCKATIEGL
jgi:hypothetical protein